MALSQDVRPLVERIAAHHQLSVTLASMSDAALLERMAAVESESGWGVHCTIEIDDAPVFVKTLPLTDLELAHPGSTRNLFELPVHYHYGVGSAGFGAERELAAHRRATEWVLAHATPHFPLLHHHRIVSLPGQTRAFSPEVTALMEQRWGGNPAIESYVQARAQSTNAVALFVEHMPHVLDDWIVEHPDFIDPAIDQAMSVATFMRERGVAHLDTHPHNVLTDGESIFISDFGLFLDRADDLDEDERTFLDHHRFYDAAQFIASLSWPSTDRPATDPIRAAALEPFRAVIDEFSSVFADLAAGGAARSRYDDVRIEALLDAALTARSELSGTS